MRLYPLTGADLEIAPTELGGYPATLNQSNSNISNGWLVVSTPPKNISQWEGLSHILWKIKNVPNPISNGKMALHS